MTFDFAPTWSQTDTAIEYGTPAARPQPPATGLRQRAPGHPTMPQLAALVEELFDEGTLSYEQLRALGAVPELRGLLGDAIAEVPETRKARSARR
ncbi:hypothetical protein [Magnetospirillum sp. UT-4]|uniref:hypothetical protein n=1 Tax=Magnetospirillum sp. UT-4 TaxID=2681467 RepID=UPI001382E44B|nr:hypothetical protein [Magnetospirillum sp. UT-4]CAA7627006.1 conserved hypothetical protein [Magnetospirillum sp. UT-4]